MFGRILLLFLVTPIVELALLLQLGEIIGIWPTLGIIVVTALAGSHLARREGLSVWRRFNERLRAGDLPGRELLDGVIILVAGALLITPGVLTDVVGFIGLVPLTRRYVRQYLNSRIQRAVERGSVRMTFGGFQAYDMGGMPQDGPQDNARREHGDDTDRERWRGQGSDRPRHRDD